MVGKLAARAEHEEVGADYVFGYGGREKTRGVNPESAVVGQQPHPKNVGKLGVGDEAAAPFADDEVRQTYVVGVIIFGNDYHLLAFACMAAHGVDTVAHYLRHGVLALQPALPYIVGYAGLGLKVGLGRYFGRSAAYVAFLEVLNAASVVERVQLVAHLVA